MSSCFQGKSLRLFASKRGDPIPGGSPKHSHPKVSLGVADTNMSDSRVSMGGALGVRQLMMLIEREERGDYGSKGARDDAAIRQNIMVQVMLNNRIKMSAPLSLLHVPELSSETVQALARGAADHPLLAQVLATLAQAKPGFAIDPVMLVQRNEDFWVDIHIAKEFVLSATAGRGPRGVKITAAIICNQKSTP